MGYAVRAIHYSATNFYRLDGMPPGGNACRRCFPQVDEDQEGAPAFLLHVVVVFGGRVLGGDRVPGVETVAAATLPSRLVLKLWALL